MIDFPVARGFSNNEKFIYVLAKNREGVFSSIDMNTLRAIERLVLETWDYLLFLQ